MKKTFLFLIAVVCLNTLIAQTSNKEILSFAQKNYLSLIGDIPEQQLPEFGLKSKAELKDLQFTDVFTEYMMKNGKMEESGNYRVLVKNANNEICGLLTIHSSNSKLSAADYGALELSKELNAKKALLNSGNYGIYRSYSAMCDYLFDTSASTEKAVFHKMFGKEAVKYTELK
jgi:hypothetical protein